MTQPADRHLVTVRDTVESVWVAIVLAFVLRAFVIEAFVIPTGSMAPRLLGQHWRFDCPACGYHFALGVPTSPAEAPPLKPGQTTPLANCPNCLHSWPFDVHQAVASGDRVLVLKYLYRFREPAPWDVVVFRNPQDNDQNYIKRLIALPGQMVELVHGDVFVRDGRDMNADGVIDEADFYWFTGLQGPALRAELDGARRAAFVRGAFADARFQQEFPVRILAKPAVTQEVMWQTIFDNDFQPDLNVYRQGQRHWEARWADPEHVWRPGADGRSFAFEDEKERRLEFRAEVERFQPVYAYNSGARQEPHDVCSDLRLSFMYVPRSPDARAGAELSSFEHRFRGTVAADGRCTLEHGRVREDGTVAWDDQPWAQAALPPLAVDQACAVALTHVDFQVTLWRDGRPVLRSSPAQYRADYAGRRARALEQPARPAPPVPELALVGLGGRLEAWHLKVQRDVYYTTPEFPGTRAPGHGTTGNPMVLRKFAQEPDRDEFFVLGDNSPASLDSRLWASHAPTLRAGYRDGTVPRYNMIGKAFFVYWPGGYPLPAPHGPPLAPNVGRMRLIR